MADDLWDRYENPANPGGFADAPQPKRRIVLIPVDHDPWASVQDAPPDGGDLSSAAARRLPGERAVAPRGSAVMPGYPQEDIEARAWAPRTGFEHIPFANAAIGLVGLTPTSTKPAEDFVHGVTDSAQRLLQHGYVPGSDYAREQAAADAFNIAGLAGTGGFGVSRIVGDAGSLGTFMGKVGAKNLAEAGRPTAMRAIAEAERLEATGKLPQDVIRLEVNKLIRAEDPRLGGVWRGDDGMWRVEISDKDARVRPAGPFISKLGREYTHPELYQAYPDMPDVNYLRTPDTVSSYHKPGDPSEIGIGERSSSKRRSVVEEVGHEIDQIEGFARGGSPDDFRPGGPLEHFLRPGETPTQGYRRLSSEVEKQIVKARIDMTPKERRNTPPWETLARLRANTPGLVPEPHIVRPTGRPESKSIGREPVPDELSAFEQAQEKGWEDLAQRGEVGQQSMWSEMGAHLNKPGQRGGGPGKAPSELWSREANLALAQMHKRGEWPSDIATKMTARFGKGYTEDRIASQLEALGLVGSNRKLPSSTVGEWQPDAVGILLSERVKGMSAAQIARLIEDETGQITTKNAVIGKMNRLRQEKARADLAEDMAKSKDVRAVGAPLSDDDAPHYSNRQPRNDGGRFAGPPKKGLMRDRLSFTERLRLWGGYY